MVVNSYRFLSTSFCAGNVFSIFSISRSFRLSSLFNLDSVQWRPFAVCLWLQVSNYSELTVTNNQKRLPCLKKTEYRVTRVGRFIVIPVIFFAAALIAFAASIDEDLVQAARNNDINWVNTLIGKGADVNATNAFLATSLCCRQICQYWMRLGLAESGSERKCKMYRNMHGIDLVCRFRACRCC